MRCQSWSEAGKTSSYGLMWTESTALQQASLQDVDSGAVEFLGLGWICSGGQLAGAQPQFTGLRLFTSCVPDQQNNQRKIDRQTPYFSMK